MGALQEQAHVNLTTINVAHTMERNKRNSIASFPLRPERANEDRDSAAGFGLGELGMNGPSQVSGVMRPPRLGRVHYSVEHSRRPATGCVWDKSSIQTQKKKESSYVVTVCGFKSQSGADLCKAAICGQLSLSFFLFCFNPSSKRLIHHI